MQTSFRPSPDGTPMAPKALYAPDSGEVGGTPPSPPPAPAPVLSLDAKVLVDGKEVPVSELISARAEAQRLRTVTEAFTEYGQASSDPERLYSSTLRMLQGMGYPNAEQLAREHVEAQFPSQPEDDGQGGEADEAPSWAKSLMAKIEEQERRLGQFSEMSVAARAEQMTEQLRTSVEKALASDEEGRTIVEALSRLNGEESVSAFRERVRRTTLQNLTDRKAKAGRLDASWIPEEAAKAARQEMATLRSVIGDPNRIGRTTETESDRDYLIRKTQPVAPPKVSRRTTEDEMTAWLNDSLFRAANEDGGGSGSTRI